MIKHDMLRHFVAVAETGSLATGAARVGRSASAVSMVLKQFQDTIGAPLFATDRKTHLTPLGVFTLEQARSELAHFDGMQRAVMRFAQTGGGLIRIASVPSVAGVILPKAIKAFHEIYANVQIDLRDMESAAVIKGVQDGAFDIGIASAPQAILSDSRQHLLDDPYGVLCAVDHPLTQHKKPLEWADLAPYDIIVGGLSHGDTKTQQSAGRLTAHNTLSLLALVQADMGVAVLPKMVSEMAWQPIKFLLLPEKQEMRKIDIFWPEATPNSPIIGSLVEEVKKAVADRLSKADAQD